MRMTIEEHGAGKQLVLFRSWPRCSPITLALLFLSISLSIGAAFGQTWSVFVILGATVLLLALRTFQDWVASTAAVLDALEVTERENEKMNQSSQTVISESHVICQPVRGFWQPNGAVRRADSPANGPVLSKDLSQFELPEAELRSKGASIKG
jgi:hypothetical protein